MRVRRRYNVEWVIATLIWKYLSECSSAQAGISTKSVYTSPTVSITPGPREVNIVEGEALQLECIIGGHPRAQPKWSLPRSLKGRNIRRGESTLLISRISRNENGGYTCTADNGHGRPQSATTIVNVYYLSPPRLRLYLPTSAVPPGNRWYVRTVILLCETTSYPQPSVAWYWRGRRISTTQARSLNYKMTPLRQYDGELSSHMLKIWNATSTHYGEYSCQTSLDLGREYWMPATIANVTFSEDIAQPSINISTGSVVVADPGSDLSLTCEVLAGYPMPIVSWVKENEAGALTLRRATKFAKSVLSLANVDVDQGGTYSCIADNLIQKAVVRHVQVVIRYIRPMKFWITPDPLSDDGKLELGKDITLTCNTDAQPVDELRYFWYKEEPSGRRSIQADNVVSKELLNPVQRRYVTIPAHSTVLEIRRATADNYGTYICKAILLNSSIAAVAEKSISITRDSAPTRVSAPRRTVVVKEQSDVRLTCEAIGQPLSRIMWLKNGNETVTTGRASVNKDGILTIKNVSRHDEAVYTCMPSLDNGFSQRARINFQAQTELLVRYPPDVHPGYEVRRVAPGSAFEIQCIVSVQSQRSNPSYVWIKNKQSLGSTSTIISESTQSASYGVYECRVTNSIGSSSCIFNVTGSAYQPEFYYQDDTINTRSVASPLQSTENANEITYDLRWTQKKPLAVAPIVEYRIRWRRSDLKTTAGRKWKETTLPIAGEIATGQLMTYKLRNLESAEYEVDVTPLNEYGYGDSVTRRIYPTTKASRRSDAYVMRFNCAFSDGDLCGFSQEVSKSDVRGGGILGVDDFDWTINNDVTFLKKIHGTGPLVDHTFREERGGYMFISSSNKRKNFRARLLSPKIRKDRLASKCVWFYYHMWGADIGRLNVLIRTKTDKLVWSRTGPKENRWLIGHITIAKYENFQVVFEAVILNPQGSNYLGNIAIDDVSIDEGPCPPEFTTAAPLSSTSAAQRTSSFASIWSNRALTTMTRQIRISQYFKASIITQVFISYLLSNIFRFISVF